MWKLIGVTALILQLSSEAAIVDSVNEVALKCELNKHGDDFFKYFECYLSNLKSSNDKVIVTSSNFNLEAFPSTNVSINVNIEGNVNYPRYFPTNLAAKLKGIHTLTYKETPLKFIKRDDFKDLGSKLVLLILEDNDIEDIPFDAFYDLTRLIYLDISGNKLTKLNAKLFANSPKFDSLFVKSNELTEIHPDLFKDCPRFYILYAEFNKIEKFDADLFQNNPNMTVISMRHNKIKNISIDFTRFKLLDVADFTHNAGACDTMYFSFKPYDDYYNEEEQKKWIKTVPEFQRKIEAVCRQ